MKEKNLKEMTQDVIQIYKRYEKIGTNKWNKDIVSKDLIYQVGILMKRLLQLNNDRYRKGLTDKELISEISDEIADIIAETLFIAHELDIDVNESWDNMLESDKKKISERSKK